jgi:hypothetical protein
VNVHAYSVAALFLMAVGAILGVVPGWAMCFYVWMLAAQLVLVALVFVALCDALWALTRGDERRALRCGGQILCLVAAAIVLPRLGFNRASEP